MGFFSKSAPPLDYTSGAGFLPKLAENEYVDLALPNKSHVYLFSMDLAEREKPYNKTHFVLEGMQKMYQDSELDKELSSLTKDYLEVFLRKSGISDSQEVNYFYNLLINGMILALVEKKSGLALPNKIHPSILFYHHTIAEAFRSEGRAQFGHIPDFRGRIDQALRGGFIIYKTQGQISANELWGNV